MSLSEARFDRKIEVLRDGRWAEISPDALEKGQTIRMWGLFIDENGNSAFKITSSMYDENGFKNIDAEPINLSKERKNEEEKQI
jgi:hypothetical protein